MELLFLENNKDVKQIYKISPVQGHITKNKLIMQRTHSFPFQNSRDFSQIIYNKNQKERFQAPAIIVFQTLKRLIGEVSLLMAKGCQWLIKRKFQALQHINQNL